jgi:hypothetical protein
MAAAQDEPAQGDLDDVVPQRQVDVDDVRVPAHRLRPRVRGIAVQRVQPAELGRHLLEQAGDVAIAGDVDLDGERRGP